MRRKQPLRRDHLVQKIIYADLINTRLLYETVHNAYLPPMNEAIMLVVGYSDNQITYELKEWYQSLKNKKASQMSMPINHREVDLLSTEIFAEVTRKFISDN